jgi:uncharacterized protein YcbK (DUF882 family)
VVFTGLALILLMAGSRAEAKPTGWRSPSEISGSVVDAWAGYGDAGYVATARKKRIRVTATARSRKAGLSAAIRASEYATQQSRRATGVRVAALKDALPEVTPPTTSATGGGVRWLASSSCLDASLAAVIGQVAANFGPVTVNSTCRSRSHNAKVGGARRSHHLSGNAVDFRVHGNVSAVYAYLRGSGSVGGLKHYGGGLFHIDTGERRTW